MLRKEQRKWIEDNYDLVEWAVAEFSDPNDEEEVEEIRSHAALLACECVDEFEQITDERSYCKFLLRKLIPMIRKNRRLLAEIELPIMDGAETDRFVDRWGFYEE